MKSEEYVECVVSVCVGADYNEEEDGTWRGECMKFNLYVTGHESFESAKSELEGLIGYTVRKLVRNV